MGAGSNTATSLSTDVAGIVSGSGSYHIRRASRAITQLYDDALVPVGLRSTQIIILFMVATHGPSPMTRLATDLMLSPSTLSRNLRPLVRQELLEVRPGPGRGKTVHLTQNGEATVREALPLWRQADDSFVAQVGHDVWSRLADDLNHAVSALKATG